MIKIKEIEGSDTISASRLTINSNFIQLNNWINKFSDKFGIELNKGVLSISNGSLYSKKATFDNIMIGQNLSSIDNRGNGIFKSIKSDDMNVGILKIDSIIHTKSIEIIGNEIGNIYKIDVNDDVIYADCSTGLQIDITDISSLNGKRITIINTSADPGTIDIGGNTGFNDPYFTEAIEVAGSSAYKSSITLQWNSSIKSWMVISAINITC